MTASVDEEPILLAFVGYAGEQTSERAVEYEDRVLELLRDHAAALVFRGRRKADQDPSLPLEIHLISFPRRAALESFLADDRRRALLEEYGEVFDRKIVVELSQVSCDPEAARAAR